MARRQTALPGVLVEAIEVESTPYDRKGVVQEYVGRGLIREFEILQPADDFEAETVSDLIESAKQQFGPIGADYRVKYTLMVRALPVSGDMGIASGIQNRTISGRARTFARVKNPFEPTSIDVSVPRKNEKLSSEEIGTVYKVRVTVTK